MPSVLATGSLSATGSVTAPVSGGLPGTDPFGIVQISGTYGSVQGVIEASFDNGTTYFAVPAMRVEAIGTETSTVSPADNASRAWQVALPGATQFRFRVTAIGSGSVSVRLLTSPVPISFYPEALFQLQPYYGEPTYMGCSSALVPAASATDIVTLTGSATRTIKIWKFSFGMSATAAAQAALIALVRSTADTGGTPASTVSLPVAVPLDSGYPAATAVPNAYTANPTLGTLVGSVWGQRYLVSTLTTAPTIITVDFMATFGQPVVLKGAAQQFCINLNGGTFSGNLADTTLVWSEY